MRSLIILLTLLIASNCYADKTTIYKDLYLDEGSDVIIQSDGNDKYLTLSHNDTNGLITSSDGTISFDDDNLLTTGTLSALSGTFSSLTSGRIPFASTGGLLTDDSALTFDSSTGTLTTGGAVFNSTTLETALTIQRTISTSRNLLQNFTNELVLDYTVTGIGVRTARALYNNVNDARIIEGALAELTYGIVSNLNRTGSDQTHSLVLLGLQNIFTDSMTYNEVNGNQTVSPGAAAQCTLTVSPTISLTAGKTLTYNGYIIDGIINYLPTETTGIFAPTIYGYAIRTTNITLATATPPFYAFYNEIDGFSTNWNIYNASTSNNYMGEDNSKTCFGTANETDSYITWDGSELDLYSSGGFNFQAGSITTTGTLSAGAITGTSLTDGTATLDDGSLTSAVNGTFSGTVQAEQLTSTDDITMAGLFTNITVAADGTAVSINGDTNPYTALTGTQFYDIDRTFNRSITSTYNQTDTTIDLEAIWSDTTSGDTIVDFMPIYYGMNLLAKANGTMAAGASQDVYQPYLACGVFTAQRDQSLSWTSGISDIVGLKLTATSTVDFTGAGTHTNRAKAIDVYAYASGGNTGGGTNNHTAYGIFVNTITADTPWAYYNDSAGHNHNGNDGIKTYFGSSNNGQIYSVADSGLVIKDSTFGQISFDDDNIVTTGSIANNADNSKHTWGAAGATDSYIQYTGSYLDFYSVGGFLFSDKIILTQTDGNEYIDSLNDGYMDYGATTQHRFNNTINLGGATNYINIATDGDITWGGTSKKKLTLRPELQQKSSLAGGIPTEVTRGLNTGYSLPIWSTPANQYEILCFRMRIPLRWDGTTDPQLGLCVSLSAGEYVGDYFKFQMVWQVTNEGDIMGTTTSVAYSEQAVLVGRNDAYDTYFIFFSFDADDANNPLVSGRMLQSCVKRIDATDPDVDNEIIIWDWASMWCVDKAYGDWSVESNDT